jgi:hypothetical protein
MGLVQRYQGQPAVWRDVYIRRGLFKADRGRPCLSLASTTEIFWQIMLAVEIRLPSAKA